MRSTDIWDCNRKKEGRKGKRKKRKREAEREKKKKETGERKEARKEGERRQAILTKCTLEASASLAPMENELTHTGRSALKGRS